MQRYIFCAPGRVNDFVLSQGLVPSVELRKSVMEEFVPGQSKL